MLSAKKKYSPQKKAVAWLPSSQSDQLVLRNRCQATKPQHRWQHRGEGNGGDLYVPLQQWGHIVFSTSEMPNGFFGTSKPRQTRCPLLLVISPCLFGPRAPTTNRGGVSLICGGVFVVVAPGTPRRRLPPTPSRRRG
ncbi:unnamed protein product, partial [Ectocarpus sp. 12 AP-2014]